MMIDLIAGARPNFMKIAPLIRALEAREAAGGSLRYRLIHTGQHYDARMSGDFFNQLGIPQPHLNLQSGSGTQAEQTAAIMIGYERVLLEESSSLCLVVGDVTSTMACAIVARKLHIPVAHVEAGIRSGDWTMPEEINRVVTDSITDFFFTTTRWAGDNLRKAGVRDEAIFLVGNTMIDTLLHHRADFRAPDCFGELGLQPGSYIVMTLHRPANVDGEDTFAALLAAIAEATRGMPLVFPVHPRTAKTLQAVGAVPPSIHLVDPMPYLEFNYLVERAFAVITDSGGITEETTVLGVPCLTMRDSTERPETVEIGTNQLIGTDPAALAPAMEALFDGRAKQGEVPELWDGHTAKRIVAALEGLAAEGRLAAQ
jgi:UDP-N-acetylglucosamine 2-epimerase (non-hydrolysing)